MRRVPPRVSWRVARNVVLCLDQSGHEPSGGGLTNVSRFFARLTRGPQQVVFYDRHAGAPERLARTLTTPRPRWLDRVLGFGFGLGFTEELEAAYRFLVQTHAHGDRLYLFGAGPGAYTARALGALLYKCGLLRDDRQALVAQALKLLKYEERGRLLAGFRRAFSRRVRVSFLGLFDPLASPGRAWDLLGLPYLRRNPRVDVVRAALALDERRPWLHPGVWAEPQPRHDVRQLWFAGTHDDVSGLCPEDESGLAQVALGWMLDEARGHGLLLDDAPRGAPPDALAPAHAASWTLGPSRRLPPGALVHRSVAVRVAAVELGYAPPDLAHTAFVDA